MEGDADEDGTWDVRADADTIAKDEVMGDVFVGGTDEVGKTGKCVASVSVMATLLDITCVLLACAGARVQALVYVLGMYALKFVSPIRA